MAIRTIPVRNMALNTSAYLQVDKKFFKERLVLSGGVRYESFKVNDDQQSVPVYRAGRYGPCGAAPFCGPAMARAIGSPPLVSVTSIRTWAS